MVWVFNEIRVKYYIIYIWNIYAEERRHNNKIKKLYFVKYNKTFILLN